LVVVSVAACWAVFWIFPEVREFAPDRFRHIEQVLCDKSFRTVWPYRLHQDAERNIAELKRRLDRGWNPNHGLGERGAHTALTLLAEKGCGTLMADALPLLLAAGADPNRPSGAGYLPLLRFAERGGAESLSAVQALVRSGADIHLRDAGGWTAIMKSDSIDGNKEMSRLLLSLGARR
jgi:hypothetical protein